ncbi:MAG TPA: hypothetical protein VNR87_16290 [Flavisolibacter sp.]|nr:hypothetical protein [Flavisolibacter sp.]
MNRENTKVMDGISNNGRTGHGYYLTPGDRTYVVGTQDGNFPDLGSHVEGEMGGLWMQPIKLLDGFWMKVSDAAAGTASWLNEAKEFVNYPYGNKFIYAPILDGIKVERFQFSPQGKQGVVVRYNLKNTSGRLRRLNLGFVIKTDLSPVWFSKENNILDASDSVSWDASRQIFVAHDTRNPWFTVWGSTLHATGHSTKVTAPFQTKGAGRAGATYYSITLKPGQNISAVFVIAGSNLDIKKAKTTYDDILKHHVKMLSDKKDHYSAIVRRAAIEIPDKKFQQAYNWGKLNIEWLVSELPGIGGFLGAGAIEYPWLFGCDNSYALQGVVATGDQALAKSTLRVIKNVSEKVNGNGRIIHEMSSNGFVGNKGNTQETPLFAIAVWKVFEWTGDEPFLKEMYPYIKKGINWLLTEQDQNRNMFPEGYGIMEVKGLNAELIDVAVYTQQALEVTAKMASILKEPSVQKEYFQKAMLLKDKINDEFWDETAGSYCDFFGTREQAISTAQGAMEQIHTEKSAGSNSAKLSKKQAFYANLVKEFSQLPQGTEKGWFTNKNWVISTPAETAIAPTDKALRLLNKVRNEHCGPYGPYLSAVEGQYMMTIATGVQAMAECAYGRTDEAMWYVNKIVETFGRVLPGSISEMMPDYGCPVQAWTIYGLASPLITHVFGIHPDAYQRTIDFAPHLPSKWDHISITNLPVGSNSLSFEVTKTENQIQYKIFAKEDGWKYRLSVKGLAGHNYTVNDKSMTAASDQITLQGIENTIVIRL